MVKWNFDVFVCMFEFEIWFSWAEHLSAMWAMFPLSLSLCWGVQSDEDEDEDVDGCGQWSVVVDIFKTIECAWVCVFVCVANEMQSFLFYVIYMIIQWFRFRLRGFIIFSIGKFMAWVNVILHFGNRFFECVKIARCVKMKRWSERMREISREICPENSIFF